MVLAAVLLLFVVLAHAAGLSWYFALVVAGLIPLAAFVGALLIARRIARDHTVYEFASVRQLLKWDSCKRCTAGTQWYNGSRWGPIPEHARVVQNGSQLFHPPQANVRKCLYCGTKGGWWTPRIPKPKKPLIEVEEEYDER